MNSRASNRSRSFLVVATMLALPAVFACAGGGDKAADDKPAALLCAVNPDTALGGALEFFIGSRNPPPHRFLVPPVVSDSALPEGAHYVVNNTLGRAMYMWPSDPAAQKTLIDVTRSKGSFVTIALFYHGKGTRPDGKQAFDFSGLYTDRANDGTRIPRTTVYFDCQAPEGSRYSLTETAAPPDGQTPTTEAGKGGGS